MKCPSCGATFKATPVDGKVTCPECSKKLKVKQKTEEKTEAPKEESKRVKEEVMEEKKITPQKEEDDFDEFDDLDEFADMDTNKKSSATLKTSSPFLFNEEDENEGVDDFDEEDEDEEEAAIKKKYNYNGERSIKTLNGKQITYSQPLTFKQAIVAVLVPCIPVVGFLLLILGACGVLFKDNTSIKNLYRAQIVVGAVAFIFMIIIMLALGTGSVMFIETLLGV